MLERLRAGYALLRLVSDIILTGLALFLASIATHLLNPQSTSGAETAFATNLPLYVYVLVAAIWGVAFLLQSVYTPRTLRAIDEAQAIFLAVSLAALALSGILFFIAPNLSRQVIVRFYVLDLLLLIGSRLLVRLSLRLAGQPRYARRKVLILGAGDMGRDTIRMIRSYRWAGLEPIGFLDDRAQAGTEVEGYPILGKIDQVDHQVQSQGIEEVVVALPIQDYERFFHLITELQALPARIRLVPDHFKTALFRSSVEEFAGVPMIMVQQPNLAPFERQIKRAFDLVIGTAMLVVILPLMALVAIAIRLDSPGPVIFRQQRVGEQGKLFWMYKFRSMVKDAEAQQAKALRIMDDGNVLHKHSEDPRVTRVGRFIRRTSLDEFPQLINVLKGEMSLVGPRPELPWLVEQYEPWQWQRFSVPQGITGWWQVNGRSDKPLHMHTEEDLFYIQNYSILLDVQILWRTIGAVLKGGGAY